MQHTFFGRLVRHILFAIELTKRKSVMVIALPFDHPRLPFPFICSYHQFIARMGFCHSWVIPRRKYLSAGFTGLYFGGVTWIRVRADGVSPNSPNMARKRFSLSASAIHAGLTYSRSSPFCIFLVAMRPWSLISFRHSKISV